jgi:hypothetical protein
MGRNAKKKNKTNTKPEKDPQEVRKDDATEQYFFRDKECQTVWHHTLHKLPSGQIVDIPYLKQLGTCVVVAIAYCKEGNIDKVTNFVPGYLARTTRRLWELYDEEDYILETFSWNEGNKTLLDLFGTSIQHPEEHFVRYFCGTQALLIEKSSPHCSPRKNPPETDNEYGRGLSSLESPRHGGADLPGQGGAKENKD